MTKPAQSKSSSPLEEFCGRHGISLAKLSDLCGGKFASRSTVHRLVKNELTMEYTERLNTLLAKSLPVFLAEKGLTAAEIDQELLEIFEEGEYQPMISQRVELNADELKWFGLLKDAFATPPESREDVFVAPELQAIIDRADDAIRYQGFIFINGKIGSGKTTVRALIEDRVAENTNLHIVWPEFFDMKNVSPMQIAEAILQAFDAPVPHSAVRRGLAVKDLLRRLYQEGKRIALGFDEVHRLADPAISSLKNFLEMSSGGFQRWLGIILFGQPIFESRLRDPRFQEIFERLVQLKMPEFMSLGPAYLAHRFALVDADRDALFDDKALDLICRQAQTPLQLGNLANQALRHTKTFKEKKVLGDLISTKMIFERNNDPSFRQRKAS